MSIQYCVARYNEDITWVIDSASETDTNVLIYNKGSRLNIPNEIMLPNVGRESHTYLHHIIENYDILHDITVFTQAKINDHGYDHNIRGFDKLIIQCQEYGHSKNYIMTNANNTVNHFRPNFNMLTELASSLHHTYMVDVNEVTKIPFFEWFKKNTGYEYNDDVCIYVAGIFVMSKQQILTRSKDYYISLYNQLSNHNAPIEGHFMERSWYYVFKCSQ